MKHGQPYGMKMVPVVLASLLLSACAISTPATITSAQGSPQRITSVQLLTESGDDGPKAGLRTRFHDELSRQLASRGVTLGSGADFVADFAVSERSAQLGLQSVPQSEGAAAQPIEPGLKGRWYHKCKPNRVSASLVVYARANGAVEAKSSGEFLACPGDLAQLDDLAKILVDRILTN